MLVGEYVIAPKERMDHAPWLVGLSAKLTPEQLLVKALLEEAVADLFRVPCNADDTRAAEAFRWIFGTPIRAWRAWAFGDFEAACQVIGVDADALRTKLRRDLARKSA